MSQPIQRSLLKPDTRWSWALVVLVLAGCAGLRVGSDHDPQASFGGYRSFAWLPREYHGSCNPLVVQRAHDAIETELNAKGLARASDPGAADFIVDFTIGARDRIDVQSYPEPFLIAGPAGEFPWWGYRYWGSEVNVRQYREGVISIDVFDAQTRRPVWHGWAKKELTRSDLEQSDAPIRTAVQAVLKSFPPGKSGDSASSR